MGMMRVNMRIHGGNQGFLDAMDGLVVRNERAIRTGRVPHPVQAKHVRFDAEPLWRDAPTAMADGVASAGTMAAWMAASERIKGNPASLAMVNGTPVVYRPTAEEQRAGVAGLGNMGIRGTWSGDIFAAPDHDLWLRMREEVRGRTRAVLELDGTVTVLDSNGEIQSDGHKPIRKVTERESRQGPTPEDLRAAQQDEAGWVVSPPSSVPLGLPPRSALMDGPGGIIATVAGRQMPQQGPSAARSWWNFGSSAFINPLGMALTPGATHRNGTLLLPFSGQIPRADLSGAISNDQGRVSEWMLLVIDDDDGLPIREIGDSIANHNAKQILASLGSSGTDAWTKEIPLLYESGVRYEVEGLPEIWKDAREILIDGFDDCEGLSAYRAGELVARFGVPAQVWTRNIKAPSDFPGGIPEARMFHAITRAIVNEREQFDDPSVRLGMPVPEWYWEYAKQRRAMGQTL